jgi:signal transduction histidine kinase
MAGCYGATAWVLWGEERPQVRWAARALATGYGIGAAVLVIRIPLLVLDPTVPWNTGNAAKTSGFFLAGIVLTSVWAFFVMLLVNRVEAHERNLRETEALESERLLREAMVELEARKAEEKAMKMRESLARDLHDGIGNITANVILLASMGANEDEAEKGKILREIEMVARRGNQEVRGLLDELDGAPISWRLFLAELRRSVVPVNETVGIATRWEITGELPGEQITDRAAAASLAKILREAAHNIVRHSGAKEAEIGFVFESSWLHIRVGDDGSGFTEGREGGRGLMNMARRCEELGGGFSIEGTERGTKISMEIALPLSQGTHKEKEIS